MGLLKMANRFFLKGLKIDGQEVSTNERITHLDKCEVSFGEDGVLELTSSEDGAIFLKANKEPTDATNIALAVISLVQLVRRDGEKYVIIKRSETLSTFPGLLSLPGGLYEESDKDLHTTARRELSEEIGQNWDEKTSYVIAVIDSVPSSSRRTITVVVMFWCYISESFEEFRSSLTSQEGEVDDILILDKNEIINANSFTPGVAALFSNLFRA